MATSLDLESFHVFPDTGFLLRDPLFTLPDYFSEWNRLAKAVPDLLATKTVREEVNKMPLLDAGRLRGHRQLRLAHLQLSLLGTAYVWQEGEDDVPLSFPACLAVPWCHVSESLGLDPMLCHADLALANWARPHLDRPLGINNLQFQYELLGGRSLQWFLTFVLILDILSGATAQHVVEGAKAVEQEDDSKVVEALQGIANTIAKMRSIFTEIHDKLTAEDFYNVLRPFFLGWGGENNPIPEGIIYEGVSDQPIQCTGSTGAQSPSLQILDAFLGIEYEPDKEIFMEKMRRCMLPAHRRLILAIKTLPMPLSSYVRERGRQEVREAYNRCVASLSDFRSYHVQIVAKYVTIPSKRYARNKKFRKTDLVGTAGSDLLPFLKDIRRTTAENLLQADT